MPENAQHNFFVNSFLLLIRLISEEQVTSSQRLAFLSFTKQIVDKIKKNQLL